RDAIVPKLLDQDVPVFMGILTDLFPNAAVPTPSYGQLENCITQVLDEMHLQNVPYFFTKCLQLYDTFNSRHGVLLMGPTCSGKTTCYKVLAKALTKLAEAE